MSQDLVKAVCTCKGLSEADTVVAIKRSRFAFIDEWGFFTWFAVIILAIITSGVWVFFILGWHYKHLIDPKYYCNQCQTEIPVNQFRS